MGILKHAKSKKGLHWIIPFYITIIFVFIGFFSINFGFHTDELRIIESVRTSFKTGIFLPGWYNYPSVSYNLAVVSTLIYLIEFYIKYHGEITTAQGFLTHKTSEAEFYLHTRQIFLFITSLTIFWVYGLIYKWRKNWIEAATGSALFAFSWEVTYHARWIAPDAIMMQFGALSMFCLMCAHMSYHPRPWLYCAAISIALTSASKYTGGLLIAPLLIYILIENRLSLKERVYQLCLSGILFIITYSIASPGTFLEFYRSLSDILFERRHYSTGHDVYTVQPGLPHFLLIVDYFTRTVFSPFAGISVFIAGCTILGGYAVVIEDRKAAVILLVFPVLFVVYISTYSVMFVRNLLICIPFLVVLATRGLGFLHHKITRLSAKPLVFLFTWMLIGINMYWTFEAAYNIAHFNENQQIHDVIAFIEANPEQKYWLTEKVSMHIAEVTPVLPSNITNNPQEATAVVFFASDVERFQANRHDYLTAWFGTREVNYNYYTSSIGNYSRRIGIVEAQKAQAICTAPYRHELHAFCTQSSE